MTKQQRRPAGLGPPRLSTRATAAGRPPAATVQLLAGRLQRANQSGNQRQRQPGPPARTAAEPETAQPAANLPAAEGMPARPFQVMLRQCSCRGFPKHAETSGSDESVTLPRSDAAGFAANAVASPFLTVPHSLRPGACMT